MFWFTHTSIKARNEYRTAFTRGQRRINGHRRGAAPAGASRGIDHYSQSAMTGITTLTGRYRRWQKRRARRRELNRLSDYILKDIGVEPHNVRRTRSDSDVW